MKRYLLFIFLCFISFTNQAFSQNHTDSINAEPNLLKADKSIISFDTSIENITHWKNFLKNDKSFSDKFCNSFNDSLLIFIAKIEQIDSVSYKFKLLSRSLNSKAHIANGYCSYKIHIGINRITKRKEILDISLLGCDI